MRKPNCETLPLRHFRWTRMARCCGDSWWKAANNGELLLTTFLTTFFWWCCVVHSEESGRGDCFIAEQLSLHLCLCVSKSWTLRADILSNFTLAF